MKQTIIGLFLFLGLFNCGKSQQPDFEQLLKDLGKDISSLDLPGLSLSYEANLVNIPSNKTLEKHLDVLQKYLVPLNQIVPEELAEWHRLDLYLLRYELTLQKEWNQLAQIWNQSEQNPDDKGILYQAQGKDWYQYFIKKWTGSTISPDSLYHFGLEEIEKVKLAIKDIQITSGMDSIAFYKHIEEGLFFLNDPKEVEKLFLARQAIVEANLEKEYPILGQLPKLRIARGANKRLAQTPGYYTNNTFYYNLFDRPYNLRQLDWLFIHEGNPGHHFQISTANLLDLPDYRNNFYYPGFAEGWAAYVENHGTSIGLYQTAYDSLGKWEWDIVRSVRVAMDVGLNYYGWSNEEALSFWKKHIPNQDEIAQREIDRMLRWPAQVHTYKLGAAVIENLRQEQIQKKGTNFNPIEFHKTILEKGTIPIEILPYLFS